MIAGLIIFLMSLLPSLYWLKKQKLTHGEFFELGEAFASGIFLGAAFFHMLPDAIRAMTILNMPFAYLLPEIICVLGFLLLLFLERLSLQKAPISTAISIPYILIIILVIHAITEGAALGLGATLTETLMLLIAIVAHKSAETFALCVTLLRNHIPLRQIILIILFFSLMTPLGIGIGTELNLLTIAQHGIFITALFSAFAAGTFLY